MIYLSGRVIQILENELVLKTNTGLGYILKTTHAKNLNIDDVVEFYVFLDEGRRDNHESFYALEYFDEWLLVRKMLDQGLDMEVSCQVIWELGLGTLQKSITTQDSSYLLRIPDLKDSQIEKILSIGYECINLSKNSSTPILNPNNSESGSEQAAIPAYTAYDFTVKLGQLGYDRSKIVKVISSLKQQEYWGRVSLIELVKKAISLIEEGYVQ
jgi:Holliday junction resolvasome RuvABC DNA-binding subunit